MSKEEGKGLSTDNNTLTEGVDISVDTNTTPATVELVGDTRISVETNLPNEIEQFIAKFNFSFDGESMILPEDLKNAVHNAQESYKKTQEGGKKLKELGEMAEHYLQGMKILNNEIDKKEEKGVISKNLSKIGHRMKRMRYIGGYLGKVIDTPMMFDRSIMEELGEGGVLELSIKSENAINSVETHYNSLIMSKDVIVSSIKTIEDDLNIINKYLTDDNVDITTLNKLNSIKSKLEYNLTMFSTKLNISITGIDYYKENIVKLIKVIPNTIFELQNSLSVYDILNTGYEVGITEDKFQELKKETTVAPFKLMRKATEEMAKRKTSDESDNGTIHEVVGILKEIKANESLIEQKRTKTTKKSAALELLINLNEESAKKREEQKLIN